ncbi:TatD family hydrolase [Vulcanisaeta thermophila]|uniref:TatD family hydrolase n=1 Tax=Vulcanisaeta thermophila TaxID=867917 RepID=UPI000853B715|nr:TatD family hydrolase [Vulcanisaeta thermophila]
MTYYDAHCHLHEFTDSRIEGFRDFIIAAVSDDYPSSRRTLELSERFGNVVPCVGIHPWVVGKVGFDELRALEGFLDRVGCIGEVGLDRRFVPETFERQLEFFRVFVGWARDYGLVLNVHAPDAWRDVFDVVRRVDVDVVVFHWFTGPLDLVEEIVGVGYYVSVNAAVKVQEKSRLVAKVVPLDRLLLESDGPYEYRGITLEPPMVVEAAELVARIKGLGVDDLWGRVRDNFVRVFGVG